MNKFARGAVVVLTVAALFICLCPASFAAAKTPPSLNDVLGSYLVKWKGSYIYFSDGVLDKWGESNTVFVLSQVSGNNVKVDIYNAFWDGTYDGYYDNGVLVLFGGDDSTDPTDYMYLAVIILSGSPGKIKLQGQFGFDLLYQDWCEMDTISGKMAPNILSLSTASIPDKQVDGITAASAYVPTIGDLAGTYIVSIKGVLAQPSTGQILKGSERQTWVVTVVDPTTLNFHSVEDDEDYLAYVGEWGTIMMATLDTDNADFGILIPSGKPGKISIKGSFVSEQNLGGLDDEASFGAVSGKQVAAPF